MAFTYGFYNSVNHDRKYDAVQMGQIFDGIITDGIYATYLKAMVVKASSNASEVIVQPGRAWFNHTWSYNDADYPVAAPEPEVVLDRIDTLVLDINAEDASRTNSFLWVQGTPTSQVPEPPALIHTATHNQYPLCDVYRKAGTTQIYAADITNRVGTSDCPFVTGVLEGINIDDLLAQWDDEFHTWENATKASFEGWMANQQEVYTAWWGALKAQMAEDVADVEDWIETIHDILDEEVATRLQAEIDEIKTELPSGSHITVTTSDSELYSRTVTITDEANHTVTSQFDATGVAVFKTVPYVGNLTISSTDGTRTATAVVQTPYFARYEFELAFWNATVNIVGDSELGGDTVTIEDSSEVLVGTVVLNASGLGVFNATYPDTYKFSVTHGGETMSVTLEVLQETTYNVEIYSGFNFKRWVTLGGLDADDYDSLSEVFADQAAVRRLMVVHASADYLVEGVAAKLSAIDDFCANDTAMKWIGLCDYVCDGLTAITGVEAKLLASTYWERYLKDHVPTMTSNTAPYGTASATSTYSNSGAYKSFDGLSTDYWSDNNGAVGSTQRIWYQFTNPICVKKIKLTSRTPNNASSMKIVASNDGTNWVDIKAVTDVTASVEYTLDVSDSANAGYYLYYGLEMVKASTSSIGLESLQFYGRALNVSVPTMTSNVLPYGEASGSSVYATNYNYYNAFDKLVTSTKFWLPATNETPSYVSYEFPSKFLAKKAYIKTAISGSPSAVSYKIEAYDGSNWVALTENQTLSAAGDITLDLNSNGVEYSKFRFYCTGKMTQGATTYFAIYDFNVFGVSYSEKEFEAGTTKKWIYDHGLELVNLSTNVVGSGSVAEEKNDSLYCEIANSTNRYAGFYTTASIDITPYSLLRCVIGDELYLSDGSTSASAGGIAITTIVPPSYNTAVDATVGYMAGSNPYTVGVDVSSFDASYYIASGVSNGSSSKGRKNTVKEIWLE